MHPEPKIFIRIQLELQVLLSIHRHIQTVATLIYKHFSGYIQIYKNLIKIHMSYKTFSGYILIYKYDKNTS